MWLKIVGSFFFFCILFCCKILIILNKYVYQMCIPHTFCPILVNWQIWHHISVRGSLITYLRSLKCWQLGKISFYFVTIKALNLIWFLLNETAIFLFLLFLLVFFFFVEFCFSYYHLLFQGRAVYHISKAFTIAASKLEKIGYGILSQNLFI